MEQMFCCHDSKLEKLHLSFERFPKPKVTKTQNLKVLGSILGRGLLPRTKVGLNNQNNLNFNIAPIDSLHIDPGGEGAADVGPHS